MKMDIDCVRSVLLALESSKYNERMTYAWLCEKLPDYSEQDIEYTCLKLEEAGFIEAIKINFMGKQLPSVMEVQDITYLGHQFLADIHQDTTWNQVKQTSKKIGSTSLKTISQIASAIISNIITSQFDQV